MMPKQHKPNPCFVKLELFFENKFMAREITSVLTGAEVQMCVLVSVCVYLCFWDRAVRTQPATL